MRELAAIALALGAVLSYFVLATRFALYQPWPIGHFLVGLAACVVAFPGLFKRRGWHKIFPILALTVSVALLALFVWYTLAYSAYDSTTAAVGVGEFVAEDLADLRFASHSGEELPVLRSGADRGTLLVFYRGFW